MKKMNTMNCFVFNLTKIPYPKAAVATVATAMKVDQILVLALSLNQIQVLMDSNKQQIAQLEAKQE